ncbi:PDR/VanB family oxidoreductase [Nocardioides alkalitolerans]|uniref:PDR/VanB family oxidoreductase n=1 Tax=Nocardioides alkalitolerans TaxID=281714 RepID=UPI0003FD70D6|nr:PDR/VanB family oxidoreductase [Nocardioides alkalitolerans]
MMEEEEGVLDLMVESLTRIADGVLQVTLVDPDGAWLPAWTPGSHIDLDTPDGLRQYSLCGDAGDRLRYTVGVLREPSSRGGSRHVHEVLRPGDVVEVGGPRNHFELLPAKRYHFVAGGIGITPLLPMLREVDARGEEWRLTYGGRTRASMGFLERLAPYGDRVELWPADESGLLPLDRLFAEAADGTAVYCCGPAGLLDVVERAGLARDDVDVHLERFTAKDLSGFVDEPLTVVASRSGLERLVAPGVSVLDVLEEGGISVPNACREGVCGSCEVAVLEGTPEHRDSIRTGAELDDTSSLAVCVSRATTPRLVLDI